MKANKKNKIKVTSRAGRKEERTAYLCLIPAFLGVSLISYLPTLAVFVLSVFKWNGLSSPEFVGLENFQRIFTKDIYFADSIKATILYALLAVVGAIIYSLLVALLLNMKIWGRTLFRSVFFIPYLLPAIGVYKGWQWLYEGNFGLFNFVLRMVFLAGLQNVPRVYMEAAEIDGANAWQRFWNVTIPSISPIIFYNVLTALITHLQVINPALALTDGGPGKKSMFMSYVIYLYAFKKNKLGYAAAYSVIFFILVGIFTAVLFKTQKEQIFGEGE